MQEQQQLGGREREYLHGAIDHHYCSAGRKCIGFECARCSRRECGQFGSCEPCGRQLDACQSGGRIQQPRSRVGVRETRWRPEILPAPR